jgi:hypothetical protein
MPYFGTFTYAIDLYISVPKEKIFVGLSGKNKHFFS